MIIETARLTLRPDVLPDFLASFAALSPAFHSSPRCLGVELMQDDEDPCAILCLTRWRDRPAHHDAADSDAGKSFIGMVRQSVSRRPVLEFWSTADIAPGPASNGSSEQLS